MPVITAECSNNIKTAYANAKDASSSSISEEDMAKVEKCMNHDSLSEDTLEQIILEYGVRVQQYPAIETTF
jgi:hypothetical protein